MALKLAFSTDLRCVYLKQNNNNKKIKTKNLRNWNLFTVLAPVCSYKTNLSAKIK